MAIPDVTRDLLGDDVLIPKISIPKNQINIIL
jgi:hypothetical protein